MVPDLTFAAAEFDSGVSLLAAPVIILTTHGVFVDAGRRAKEYSQGWKDAGKGENHP